MIIVIPARGGSRRLPHKNILPLRGKPLLAYTLDAVKNSGLALPVYVSTDDDAIAAVVRQNPGPRVIRRPAELAADISSTESALLHALDNVPEKPEWIMTLPPTSPFRTGETIRRFADAVKSSDAPDCLMSVTENRGYFWQEKDGEFVPLFPDASRRQQERAPLYEENSAIYVTKVSALRDTGTILGRSICGLPVSAIEGFDINTPGDFALAEALAATL